LIAELGKLQALLRGVHNPLPAVFDRLGLLRSPYELHHKDGHRVEVRPRAGDLFGFFEILLRGDYTSSGQRISKGATVIDVGANIGCFSILASHAVGPTGRVIAIEPDAATFRQLLRNIEINGLRNVTPLQFAIGAEEGTVLLHSDPHGLFSSLFSSVNGRTIQGVDREVRMTTLHSLMEEQGVHYCEYLKLDCEGAEHAIIQSLSSDVAARVSQITLEIHKIPGFDGKNISSKLGALGYERVSGESLPYYRRSRLAFASPTQ